MEFCCRCHGLQCPRRPFLRASSALDRGFLKKKGGLCTIHSSADPSSAWPIFRTINHANQLSIYGAIEDCCDDLTQQILGQSFSSIKGGECTTHSSADLSNAELLFRAINSANQLSICGAIADRICSLVPVPAGTSAPWSAPLSWDVCTRCTGSWWRFLESSGSRIRYLQYLANKASLPCTGDFPEGAVGWGKDRRMDCV